MNRDEIVKYIHNLEQYIHDHQEMIGIHRVVIEAFLWKDALRVMDSSRVYHNHIRKETPINKQIIRESTVIY